MRADRIERRCRSEGPRHGCVRRCLRPDPRSVRALLADLRGIWAEVGLSGATCDRAELVLAEALNNVVEHALPDGDGRIGVQTCQCANGIVICLCDGGAPMPENGLPSPCRPEPGVTMDEMPEGGFGWYLISILADEVTYVRAAETNELRIHILDGGTGGTKDTCVQDERHE